MSIKIAIVGAGGIGFARRLMRDVLSVPELAATRFAFGVVGPSEPRQGDRAMPPRHRRQRTAGFHRRQRRPGSRALEGAVRLKTQSVEEPRSAAG